MTIMEKFANCHESFREKVEKLAAEKGKTVEAVYAMWREYAEYCTAGDQSPVWFEFQEWYKEPLNAQ